MINLHAYKVIETVSDLEHPHSQKGAMINFIKSGGTLEDLRAEAKEFSAEDSASDASALLERLELVHADALAILELHN